MTCNPSCQCGGVYRHRTETRRQFILVCDNKDCEAVILMDKAHTHGERGGQDNEPEDPGLAYQPTPHFQIFRDGTVIQRMPLE